MSKNDRFQALQVLMTMLENKTPLTYLLQNKADISPLTRAICFGVCRHYIRLQVLADSLVAKRPTDQGIWLALLIGLYQLQFLDKPEYATVKETVDLVDKLKKSWAKGLINAVLRRFCRERVVIMQQMALKPDFIFGHPSWFIKKIKKDWPLHWKAILTGNDQHPPMSLRINQQQLTREAWLLSLEGTEINAKPMLYSTVGVVLDNPCDVRDLPGFSEGHVSVQDEAAQLAVSLLALEPGLRVLDACAAPGGKTCHIVEAEPNLLACVAIDIDEHRLQRVRDNLARLHLDAMVTQGDALNPAEWWDGEGFDRILLDAPCSATGVIRRHPDIKLLRTAADIEAITQVQGSILQSLWPLLKPGGLMVYATCSVLKQENQQQIEAFLGRQPDSQLIDGDYPWGHNTGFGWQIIPGDANSDGFFYSVLKKKSLLA